jgi:hypothetical protein
VPADLHGVIAIAAGQRKSLALVAEHPSLLTSAATQTAEVGSTVRFQVCPSGYSPLFYQWFFNGTNLLSGATNSVLELADVGSSQTGSYTVVITNIAGAVTSAPAMLSVIPPVERKILPALTLLGHAGSALNLEDSDTLGPSANWATLDNVALISTPPMVFRPLDAAAAAAVLPCLAAGSLQRASSPGHPRSPGAHLDRRSRKGCSRGLYQPVRPH